MHPYSYIVSLRVSHPRDDLSYVSTEFNLEPEHLWQAGEERKTPKGTTLGGARAESYWVARLTDKETHSESWRLEDFLDDWLARLSGHEKFTHHILSGGGRIVFYVSLYGSRNFGVELSPRLLGRLAEAKVNLMLDVYPVPW